MRIFVDARSLLEKKPSGISRYSKQLIYSLLTFYPDKKFVLFTNSYTNNDSLQIYRAFPNCEIVSTRIPNKILHASFGVLRFPSLETFAKKCDVYFFPNVMYLPRLPFASVLTVHDISYLQLPRAYSFRNHLWYRMVRARSLIGGAREVVVDSNATKLAVLQHFPKKKQNISVVYPALIKPTLPVQRKKSDHLLVLGDIDERKNIYGILSAYEQVRSQDNSYKPLLFVGKRGYVNLRASTLRLFNTLKRRGWIQERGYVSEKEKWDLLSHAQGLVFVSFYEGFGFPGLEAESLGIPIIASARTCMPEVFGKGPLYVNPDNIQSIVHAMQLLPTLSTHVSYDNPLVTRSWEQVASVMMNIFTKVAYENRN